MNIIFSNKRINFYTKGVLLIFVVVVLVFSEGLTQCSFVRKKKKGLTTLQICKFSGKDKNFTSLKSVCDVKLHLSKYSKSVNLFQENVLFHKKSR